MGHVARPVACGCGEGIPTGTSKAHMNVRWSEKAMGIEELCKHMTGRTEGEESGGQEQEA